MNVSDPQIGVINNVVLFSDIVINDDVNFWRCDYLPVWLFGYVIIGRVIFAACLYVGD